MDCWERVLVVVQSVERVAGPKGAAVRPADETIGGVAAVRLLRRILPDIYALIHFL